MTKTTFVVACDDAEPVTGYRCERPIGHDGDHLATFGCDEEGQVPDRTWPRIAAMPDDNLAWLNEMILGDPLGHVTFTANDSAPMRTVNLYLGEATVPVGVGLDVAEAIGVARAALPSSTPTMAATDATQPLMMTDNGFPRRNRMVLWTEAEAAIQQAVDVCERSLPADVLETEAIILLGKARDKVADLVEREIAAGRMLMPSPSPSSTTDDGPLFDDGTLNAMCDGALRLADSLDDGPAASTIQRLVRHLRRERQHVGPRTCASPSSTTATPAMTLNEEPAACGYCSSADFREDDDQKFDAPAFGHRHLHSGCRNEIVMAIRATMGFEQASSSAPDYRRQVTMSESTVRDYHRLREALGVGPDVSFDHCITLVRQYVYYGKNPPSDATCDQCRLPLRRTLSDEALRAVVRDGDKSIGESLDALNELNRRSGCALPSSRALSEEERKRTGLMEIEARTVAEARAWLANDFGVPVPRLDHLLRIIDRLTALS